MGHGWSVTLGWGRVRSMNRIGVLCHVILAPAFGVLGRHHLCWQVS